MIDDSESLAVAGRVVPGSPGYAKPSSLGYTRSGSLGYTKPGSLGYSKPGLATWNSCVACHRWSRSDAQLDHQASDLGSSVYLIVGSHCTYGEWRHWSNFIITYETDKHIDYSADLLEMRCNQPAPEDESQTTGYEVCTSPGLHRQKAAAPD